MPGVETFLDNVPIQHPYLPRLCAEQGHVLLWSGDQETDPDLVNAAMNAKDEKQWVSSKDPNRVEKAVALVWEYEDEFILGTVKYAGYMQMRSNQEVKDFIGSVWDDIVEMLGHKKIICPTGSYIQLIHLYMNQKKIQRLPYHYKVMRKHQFKKAEDYWVRDVR